MGKKSNQECQQVIFIQRKVVSDMTVGALVHSAVRSGQINAVICFHCVCSDVKSDRAPRVGRVTSVSWEKAFPCATQNRREVELEVPFPCLFSSLSPTLKNYGSSEATGTLVDT